ncbi:hypothetical protein BJ165DRAFT_1447444 [Panaeolus papilionaceus]|nr:hypothetical protein BJ165DRAFT_1447444 [Panaeolus papilionaceus]
MIGNTFWDYVKIQAGITALRLVVPLSCLYLVLAALNTQLLYWSLVVYTITELLFYSLIYLPRKKKFQQPPVYVPPNLTRDQRFRIVQQCIATGFYTATPHSPYPSCWFLPHNHGSRASRTDVRDWLAWALFSIEGQTMSREVREELDEYVKLLEEASGVAFADENEHDANKTKKNLRGIRVSLDPVLAAHRPLIWYMIVAVVDAYTSIRLFRLGFRHYTPSEPGYSLCFPPRPILYLFSRTAPRGIKVPFWYRPHRTSTKHPLIFIHGIGIGLFPYIPFLNSVTQGDDKDVGVVIPELLPISMHMTRHTVPPRPDILRTLTLIVESIQIDASSISTSTSHPNSNSCENATLPLLNAFEKENKAGWDDIVLAGHSYGTFIAGWIIREFVDYVVESQTHIPKTSSSTVPPRQHQKRTLDLEHTLSPSSPLHHDAPRPSFFADRVSHFVLVDPIPILLSNPSVAYNFLYRDPHTVCPRCHNTICNAVGSSVDPAQTRTSNSNQNQNTNPSQSQSPIQPRRTPSLYTQATYTSTQSQSASASIPSYVNTPHPLVLSPQCPGAGYSAPSAWQLWYFASRDADVARTLFRSFFWAEGGVWRGDLGVILGSAKASVRDGREQSIGGGANATRPAGLYGSMSPPQVSTSNLNASSGVQSSSNVLRRRLNPIRTTKRTHRKMAVVLAGLDQVVPSEAVRHHLTQNEEWVERWVGQVDGEGEIREVTEGDWEYRFGDTGAGMDAEVSIRVERVGEGGNEEEREGEGEDEGGGGEGTLEVLFNPILDHASIFDSEIDSVPLVEVVRRYIGDM